MKLLVPLVALFIVGAGCANEPVDGPGAPSSSDSPQRTAPASSVDPTVVPDTLRPIVSDPKMPFVPAPRIDASRAVRTDPQKVRADGKRIVFYANESACEHLEPIVAEQGPQRVRIDLHNAQTQREHVCPAHEVVRAFEVTLNATLAPRSVVFTES